MLQISQVSKRFGDLVANDSISLTVAPGQVLALLGENGAGKSTLVSILFGHYLADSGVIEVDGRRLPPGDTRAALAAGVGMVHQHFALADNLTVLDNVMAGQEPLSRWRSSRAQFRAHLLEASQSYGLLADPDARVRDLSVGERQRVEILKALTRGARYLILDEPTAVLTPGEVEQLFATLRLLIAKGLAVIFISHKLPEVMAISHRIIVLRAGRVVAEMATAQASVAGLAMAMIGRQIETPDARVEHAAATEVVSPADDAPQAEDASPTARSMTMASPGARRPILGSAGDVVLALQDIDMGQSGQTQLTRLNLKVARGEIVAVAGVAGNGQQALAELLAGERAADAGKLEVFGQSLAAAPAAWIAAGVARVPEDRQLLGAVGDLDLPENAVVSTYRDPQFCRWPALSRWIFLLDRQRMRARAQAIVEAYDVRFRSLDAPIRNLSGGNIQKFILGRELGGNPGLVIANQPTWGLDIGAVEYVHGRLRAARDRGAGVLLISEDLDEIFALADRVAVICRGRLTAARATHEWTADDMGLAMAGQGH